MTGATSPMLRYVLRHHSKDLKGLMADMADNQIETQLAGDEFSLSQWNLGVEYFRDRLRAFGVNGEMLIDIGCGSGNWSVAAGPFFDQIFAVDRNAPRLTAGQSIARQFAVPNITFVEANCCALPIIDSCADWVLLYNIIQHLSHWKTALSEANRVLKKGGRLWVAWHDVGYAVFCLCEAALLARPTRAIQGTAMLCNRMLPAFTRLRPYAAPNTISRHNLETALQSLNLVTLWRSYAVTDTPTFPSIKPLYCASLFGVPFFHELLAVKQ